MRHITDINKNTYVDEPDFSTLECSMGEVLRNRHEIRIMKLN